MKNSRFKDDQEDKDWDIEIRDNENDEFDQWYNPFGRRRTIDDDDDDDDDDNDDDDDDDDDDNDDEDDDDNDDHVSEILRWDREEGISSLQKDFFFFQERKEKKFTRK